MYKIGMNDIVDYMLWLLIKFFLKVVRGYKLDNYFLWFDRYGKSISFGVIFFISNYYLLKKYIFFKILVSILYLIGILVLCSLSNY